MLEKLTRDDFVSHEGETFRLEAEGRTLDVKLVEVSHVGEEKKGQTRRTFSVVFRGPKDLVLDQQICKLTHDEMGELDLFLVTVGPDDEGMCYEAVFN